MLSYQGARTLDYPTINSNPRWSAPYDHNPRLSQTDGRTSWQ